MENIDWLNRFVAICWQGPIDDLGMKMISMKNI